MNFATDADVLSKNERNESETGTSFDYLLNMALYSLTKEKVQELRNKIGDKKTQIEKLERQTVEELWLIDLEKFEVSYRKDLEKRGFSADTSSANLPQFIH